jgi:putative heme iron utilization protein
VEQGKITLADAARTLIRRLDAGVLSTHSVEIEGYPFGSLTPFVASHEGRPVIYVSAFAQHTRNILTDSRLCLTVYDPAEKDKQASSRVSIMGNAAPVPDTELKLLAERYFAFFPGNRKNECNPDFKFYWIEPHKVRFISGFGRIHWLPKEGWILPPAKWKSEEAQITADMNGNHSPALIDMCRYFHETHPKCAQMIAADPEGFHVRADEDILYFVFERPYFTAKEIRAEIARMMEQSKA